MKKAHDPLPAAAQSLSFRHLTPGQWQMWRQVMRRQPQWFILRQSGKWHDRWRAMAGPFGSPEEACSARAQIAGEDSRRARLTSERWQVASLTETMRIYHGNVPLLVDDLVTAEPYLRAHREDRGTPEYFALA